jgi:hypothetical protein
VAADALFIAQGVRAGDFSAVLTGLQRFESLYFSSTGDQQAQLRQALWFDLLADLF